ncbi:unnamed protein product [Choristocarpus tenellus]
MLCRFSGKLVAVRPSPATAFCKGARGVVAVQPWLSCEPPNVSSHGLSANSRRELSDVATTWPPGHPAPGREQTLGEVFAAMEHHARGARKVKLSALDNLIKKVESPEDLKYATLALELFDRKKMPVSQATAKLFIKTCCQVGKPQIALTVLGNKRSGIRGYVTADNFNYLLTQLHREGDTSSLDLAISQGKSRGQALDNRSLAIFKMAEAAAASVNSEQPEKSLTTGDKPTEEVEEEGGEGNVLTEGEQVSGKDTRDKVEETTAEAEVGIKMQ